MADNNDQDNESLEGSDDASIEMADWTVRQVSRWIADIGHAQYCENFEGMYLSSIFAIPYGSLVPERD